MMTDVYTVTLNSGLELSIPIQAGFGEIMIAGTLLLTSAVLGLDFLIKMVYRK